VPVGRRELGDALTSPRGARAGLASPSSVRSFKKAWMAGGWGWLVPPCHRGDGRAQVGLDFQFSPLLFWLEVPTQNHRIIGWKSPLRSLSPTVHPTPPFLLNHAPRCHIYTFFEPFQGWGLPHCPGQPGPMPDHSFRKEIFPNLQSKPPLMQPEAIAPCPMASYLGEQTNPPSLPPPAREL